MDLRELDYHQQVRLVFATATPRAVLDVEGDTRLKSYHEAPVTLTSSGQVVNIDLSKGQTFELTTTENIVEFRISNFVADMATSFTIKILQGSTARTVDIDDFKNSAGSASIPVNWQVVLFLQSLLLQVQWTSTPS